MGITEESKPGLTLVEFFKQFFGNYKGFLETHLKTDRPPFLVLMIWFLGMASIINRMEFRYMLSSKYQMDNWVSTWLLILFGGILSGYLGYWVAGSWYHLRVLMSGGLRNFKTSRYLNLYTGLPLYAVSILYEVFDTIVYGDKYFTEPTSWDLDLMWSGLSVVGMIYSISLSYRGVRLLQETKRIRSIILFIILPALFYALVFGGFFFKTYSEYSKGLNYNDQALEAMVAGNYERAEELLRHALKYMTKDEKEDILTIYENLALAHEYQEETEEAMECYEEILSLVETNGSQYHSVMGKIMILKDSIHVAIAHFDRALQLDTDNFDAHNQLGLIYLGMVDEEIENFERALIHNERAYSLLASPATMENLAMNYFFLERYSDALPLFQAVDEMVRDRAVVKYFLGLIHYVNGDLNRAADLLEQAILLNPDIFSEEVEKILKEASDRSGAM